MKFGCFVSENESIIMITLFWEHDACLQENITLQSLLFESLCQHLHVLRLINVWEITVRSLLLLLLNRLWIAVIIAMHQTIYAINKMKITISADFHTSSWDGLDKYWNTGRHQKVSQCDNSRFQDSPSKRVANRYLSFHHERRTRSWVSRSSWNRSRPAYNPLWWVLSVLRGTTSSVKLEPPIQRRAIHSHSYSFSSFQW